MVRSKVNSLRKTVESKRHGILELNSVKECLKELQEKYLFVPAGKAANNIVACVSVTTWRSFAKSLVCGRALQVVTLTFLKLWILKKSAETTFPT